MATETIPSFKPLWSGFTYYEHQVRAIDWMMEKEMVGSMITVTDEPFVVHGGILAFSMGVGKSFCVTGVMKNNPKKRTLLMAPLAMLDTWLGIVEKANFNVFVINGDKWTSYRDRPIYPRLPSAYVCNYEKLLFRRDMLLGKDVEWDRVVLDESHKIRNFEGIIARRAMRIRAKYRWCMTGTPIVNRMDDLASQMKFLGFPIDDDRKWEPKWKASVPQIMIQMSLDSLRGVVPDVPPVPVIEEQVLDFDNALEKEFYRAIQNQIKEKLMRRRYKRDGENSMLALLMRLRQISVHPQVYINGKKRSNSRYRRPEWLLPSTKFLALRKILEEERDGGHKYLVFCQFHDEMKLLKKYLEGEGLAGGIEMYHGGLSLSERTEVLERARGPECQVLLCQLLSGAVGLNLQEFDRVVFMSRWWTSAQIEQGLARCVRIGQKKVVRVVFLTLKEEKTLNIDQFIKKKTVIKKELLEMVFRWVGHF